MQSSIAALFTARRAGRQILCAFLFTTLLAACSEATGPGASSTGGRGGSEPSGGVGGGQTGAGGATSTATGGSGSGGSQGGASGSGGLIGTGGRTGVGGAVGSGGTVGAGGSVGSAGSTGTGGNTGSGGSAVTGGSVVSGGTRGTGTGGIIATGGTGGGSGIGGTRATGGSGGTGGSSDTGESSGTGGSSGSGGTTGTCAAVPVTPNATQQVRNVLCYLYSQYGNHILSGQEESGAETEINYIFTNTGKYPAIRAFEANGDGAGTRCVSYWNQKGLCMFGYHMGAPSTADGYNGSKTKLTPSIADALTAGTANNTVLNQRLTGLANRLLAVQAANGVVIFRPYHEAGGTWFWWSMESGAEFVKLWKYTFDFMVGKGIKNTIWLLALDGSAKSAFFPGAQYVDIGGADNYNKAYDYSPMTSIYNNTVKIFPTGMPIALHECGPIPDSDQLQSTKTNWVFFSIWTSPYPESYSTVAQLQKVYTSSYVVTRDEMPDLR